MSRLPVSLPSQCSDWLETSAGCRARGCPPPSFARRCQCRPSASSLEIECVLQGTPGIFRGAAPLLFDDAVSCAGAKPRFPHRVHPAGLFSLTTKHTSFRRRLRTSLAMPAGLRNVVRIGAICRPGLDSSFSAAAGFRHNLNPLFAHVFWGSAWQDHGLNPQLALRLGR